MSWDELLSVLGRLSTDNRRRHWRICQYIGVCFAYLYKAWFQLLFTLLYTNSSRASALWQCVYTKFFLSFFVFRQNIFVSDKLTSLVSPSYARQRRNATMRRRRCHYCRAHTVVPHRDAHSRPGHGRVRVSRDLPELALSVAYYCAIVRTRLLLHTLWC